MELVKGRAYQLKEKEDGRSGIRALDMSLYFFVKMLAPYMPFVTDYIWRQRYNNIGSGVKSSESAISVHTHPWQLQETEREQVSLWKLSLQNKELLNFSFFVLQKIRAFKASKKKSLSTKVKSFEIKVDQKQADMFEICQEDLIRAGQLDAGNISLKIVKDLKEESDVEESKFFEPILLLED